MIREGTDNSASPIFIMASARSGSTLLRYIIDTHPDICCPAELNLGNLCSQLLQVHSYTTAQVSTAVQEREIQQRIYAEVRQTVSDIMLSYATARDKKNWCEKSSGNLVQADTLMKVFPGAKYVCLHRHCMDVVYSLLEMSRFGFVEWTVKYVHKNPRNIVAAMAEYWADYTERLLRFERQYSADCFRIKYETLVTDPSTTLKQLFAFLDVDWDQSLLDKIFSVHHDQGPGDIKISFEKDIHKNSLGKGSTILGSHLGSMHERVNLLLEELGYSIVGPDWNVTPHTNNAATTITENEISSSIREIFTQKFPRRLSERRNVLRGLEAVYKFIVPGNGNGVWMVDLREDVRVTTGNGNANCTITISAGDLIAMVNGTLNPGEAFLQEKVNVAGDGNLAKKLGEILFGP